MCGSGWWPAGQAAGDGVDAVAYACGLAVAAGLADRFGHQGSADGAAVLWAEVSTSNGSRVLAQRAVHSGFTVA